jgi:hypothetical protein
MGARQGKSIHYPADLLEYHLASFPLGADKGAPRPPGISLGVAIFMVFSPENK